MKFKLIQVRKGIRGSDAAQAYRGDEGPAGGAARGQPAVAAVGLRPHDARRGEGHLQQDDAPERLHRPQPHHADQPPRPQLPLREQPHPLRRRSDQKVSRVRASRRANWILNPFPPLDDDDDISKGNYDEDISVLLSFDLPLLLGAIVLIGMKYEL